LLSRLIYVTICSNEANYRLSFRRRALEPSDLAHLIVNLLEERQAGGIILLDLRDLTPLADYFVICTVESERQAKALQELLGEQLKKEHNVRPLSTEGEPASGWVLLDYNAVVVHIFSPQGRTFYRLEEVWRNAPVVLKIQ
jgi:ribosome-associated protein